MSPQVLQRFMELLPTMGLTTDMLAILPKTGEWPKAQGGSCSPSAWGLCAAQGAANGTLTPLFAFQQINASMTSGEWPGKAVTPFQHGLG